MFKYDEVNNHEYTHQTAKAARTTNIDNEFFSALGRTRLYCR